MVSWDKSRHATMPWDLDQYDLTDTKPILDHNKIVGLDLDRLEFTAVKIKREIMRLTYSEFQ